MNNRNVLMLIALVSLLALAGIGAWLLMDDAGKPGVAQRPSIPRTETTQR